MEENRKNRKTGTMPTMNSWQRVSFIWGPVFLKWGISIAVSLAAAMLIVFGVSENQLADVMSSEQAMMQFVQEIAMKYTVPIEGAAALVTIPVMLYMMKRDRMAEAAFGVAQKQKAPVLTYGFAMMIAGFLAIACNNLIVIGNLSQFSASYKAVAESFASPSLVVQIVCLCLLTPVAEELVFRGLVYRRIRRESRSGVAIVYSALIFAVIHGNFVQGLYAFAMGIMLGYVCEKFGSVKAACAAHITANLVTLLASEFGFFAWEAVDIFRIGPITVECAVLATIVYLRIRRMDADAGRDEAGTETL